MKDFLKNLNPLSVFLAVAVIVTLLTGSSQSEIASNIDEIYDDSSPAAVTTASSNSQSVNQPLVWFDESLYRDNLKGSQRVKALRKLSILKARYRNAWTPVDTNFLKKSSPQAVLSRLRVNWNAQKQSYLAELALRKEYGLFYEDTDYDQYIKELQDRWNEQEKGMLWYSGAVTGNTSMSAGATLAQKTDPGNPTPAGTQTKVPLPDSGVCPDDGSAKSESPYIPMSPKVKEKLTALTTTLNFTWLLYNDNAKDYKKNNHVCQAYYDSIYWINNQFKQSSTKRGTNRRQYEKVVGALKKSTVDNFQACALGTPVGDGTDYQIFRFHDEKYLYTDTVVSPLPPFVGDDPLSMTYPKKLQGTVNHDYYEIKCNVGNGTDEKYKDEFPVTIYLDE